MLCKFMLIFCKFMLMISFFLSFFLSFFRNLFHPEDLRIVVAKIP